MTASNDWNQQIVDEFRANSGRVGGNFDGAPMVLLHHVGRKSAKHTVSPVVYLPDADDANTIFVFASAAGAKSHPAWYFNLTAAGTGTVEVGDETYGVTIDEVQGAERDRIYAEQASAMPGFAEYEQKTEGIRTIPVLALRRSS